MILTVIISSPVDTGTVAVQYSTVRHLLGGSSTAKLFLLVSVGCYWSARGVGVDVGVGEAGDVRLGARWRGIIFLLYPYAY